MVLEAYHHPFRHAGDGVDWTVAKWIWISSSAHTLVSLPVFSSWNKMHGSLFNLLFFFSLDLFFRSYKVSHVSKKGTKQIYI
jgi:hypothetical protein